MTRSVRTLRLVVFAGASNWPLWAAEAHGFLAAEGLAVTVDVTPNSTEMAANLHAGRYDLALSSIDNIVAYNEGQGATDVGQTDFVALFGVDDGLLSVMADPAIASLDGLKGKTLSLDAPATGFAFVLRAMLEQAGLAPGDVAIARVGGGAQRLDALLRHDQDGTLLNAPLDLVAEANGFRRLATATATIGPYQGVAGASRRDWAAQNRAATEGFIRAFHGGVGWIADPAHRDAAITLLMSKMRGMDRATAERAYARLLDLKTGIHRDLRIDVEGLRTVLRLRSAYALPQRELNEPQRYVDLSYLTAALRA